MKKRTKVSLRPLLAIGIILLLLTVFGSAAAASDEAVDIADTADQETATAVQLPVGSETFKREVDQDGLYAVTGADLAAAGMNLAAVDPDQIQMMQNGNAVAYQFVNVDGKAGFGTTDEVRFFGWAFDGSRYEDMYISNNIFWLWAGGTANQVQTANNEAGKGYTNRQSNLKWHNRPHGK